MSYEIRFIQRLARLGQTTILSKFKHAFRYIDDLCWINVGEANVFLDPTQPRHKDNPFWIYPLDIIEIKTVFSVFNKMSTVWHQSTFYECATYRYK